MDRQFQVPDPQMLEFEQSLTKLSHLHQHKAQMRDFTARDKHNLLDLFVNNERTLKAIFEILFPQQTVTSQFLAQ